MTSIHKGIWSNIVSYSNERLQPHSVILAICPLSYAIDIEVCLTDVSVQN